jgi:hypothetical protein
VLVACAWLGAPGAQAEEAREQALRARVAALERLVAELEEALAGAEARLAGETDARLREAWRDPGRWSGLRRGMSRFDVMRLLGEPGKVVVYDGFERWEYPDLLGGRVNFDDRGAVSGWRAPPPERR